MAHKSDVQVQGEFDANTLAEADVIRQTPGRMKAAKSAAKTMADESAKRTKGLKKVARKK